MCKIKQNGAVFCALGKSVVPVYFGSFDGT